MARVVETGITPIINTAIASREPGVGMVGAGIAKAPMQLFTQALLAYGEQIRPVQAEEEGALKCR